MRAPYSPLDGQPCGLAASMGHADIEAPGGSCSTSAGGSCRLLQIDSTCSTSVNSTSKSWARRPASRKHASPTPSAAMLWSCCSIAPVSRLPGPCWWWPASWLRLAASAGVPRPPGAARGRRGAATRPPSSHGQPGRLITAQGRIHVSSQTGLNPAVNTKHPRTDSSSEGVAADPYSRDPLPLLLTGMQGY